MPLDTRIALGVQPLQLADPLAREGQVQNILAAQAQQRAAGTQQQHSQLQMEQMQRQLQQDESYVSQMADAIGKNGGPPDIMQAFRIMSINRNPQISQHGITGLQSLQRLDEAKKAGIYGAPTDLATPAPASVVNQLTPPAAAPVNQLAATPQADAAKALQTEYMKLSQFTDVPGVKERMDLIKEQLKELSTPRVVGRNLVTGAGNVLFTAPQDVALSTLAKLQAERTALPADDPRRAAYDAAIAKESQFAPHAPPAESSLAKLQREMAALPPGDSRIPQYVAMINKEITRAPGTVVNVSQSTEKKYGEAFGGKIADRDVAMLDTATRAPDLAANANRVLSILSQGNVFTGSAADIKLNMARALNLAGAGNDEKIANTEMLVSGLARQTLGAVKSSGLGTGQGFTDKDLQFLQDAEGGRITLNAQTIQRLAVLSHSAADKSATAWNKRVKEIPKSATEGTGLSTEPVVVPKRFGAVATPAAPATGAVQNGYRFKGGDPAVAANWEKL